jgi:soluble lytic murein transglycosylase-like protein|tara:strand:+ start:29 stop:460 length:432 start_codon:yes stop_codon:yes gene_type:complete
MTWTELVVSVCGTFMSPNLDDHILDVAEYNNIDKEIVLSVVYQESRCNTNAIGAVGELGMMQIFPRWHMDRIQRLEVENLLDPYSNLIVGVDLLAELGADKNPYKALAMYNGGYTPPESSKKYASNVVYRANQYKNKLNSDSI